jgi:antitoxin component of MazEF toxin-antitoxin module
MAQTFSGRVFKRGGSMGITVKRAICNALGWVPGDTVIMAIYGKHLVIRRVGRDDVLQVDAVPVSFLPGARADDKTTD